MATFEKSQSNSMDVSESPWTPLSSGRLGAGVFYGILLGSIYALVTQVIDVVMLTDLPLRTDWPAAIGLIVASALSGGALGVVVAWPEETWKGILAGAVAIALWGLVKSAMEISAFALLFLPTLLPLVLLGVPIAAVLRLTINWHHNSLEEVGMKRMRGLALLVAGVVAVAAFAGSWARMPAYAEEAVRKVDRVIQFAIQNPDKPISFSLRDVPQVLDHLDSPYTIIQVPVDSTSTGVEVNVFFEDGFRMSCLIGQQGDIPYCQRGQYVFSNPGGSGS